MGPTEARGCRSAFVTAGWSTGATSVWRPKMVPLIRWQLSRCVPELFVTHRVNKPIAQRFHQRFAQAMAGDPHPVGGGWLGPTAGPGGGVARAQRRDQHRDLRPGPSC